MNTLTKGPKPTTPEISPVVPRELPSLSTSGPPSHMAIPMDTPIHSNQSMVKRRSLTAKEKCEVFCGILVIIAVLIGIGLAMFFILGALSKAKYNVL